MPPNCPARSQRRLKRRSRPTQHDPGMLPSPPLRRSTPMCEKLEAAREYHRRGLPITLCPVGAKNPLGEGWSESNVGLAWQKKQWTAREIDRAFKLRGDLNVGCL